MAFNVDYISTEAFYQEIQTLAMVGLSLKQCGDYFEAPPKEWDNWCKEDERTVTSHDCGKAKGLAVVGKQLINLIKQGKIQAIMFYLKTQGNFTERSVMEIQEMRKIAHMPAPAVPIDPVEASKLYAQYMKDS